MYIFSIGTFEDANVVYLLYLYYVVALLTQGHKYNGRFGNGGEKGGYQTKKHQAKQKKI